MKILFSRGIIQAIFVFITVCDKVYASTVAEARISFKVVDEKKNPVDNVVVRGGGWIPDGSVSSEFNALTDANGIATVDIRTAYDVGCTFQKSGHYDSEFYYAFGSEKLIRDGRWPQSGFTNSIVLKHIVNPIPMYVKAVEAQLPVLGKQIGFDLVKGEWVAPYGKGAVPDFKICVTGKVSKVFGKFGGVQLISYLYMRVTFSNKGDGIQTNSVPMHKGGYLGSRLVTDHEAPADGYRDEYIYERRKGLTQRESINVYPRDDQIAYFRVRTELDETGRIKKAWYGTMRRDLWAHFRMDGSVWVSFRYDLNPDGTRNVERAQGVNLLR